jgi:hypothetical protein
MIDGALAGFVAGLAVMVLLLVHDFLIFEPFVTPQNLSERLAPFADSLATASIVTRVGAFTVVHLAVFTFLGVGAAALLQWSRLQNTVLFALLYGVVVCTIVFDVSPGLTDMQMKTVPAWPVIIWANAFAGGVMGLVLRFKTA